MLYPMNVIEKSHKIIGVAQFNGDQKCTAAT